MKLFDDILKACLYDTILTLGKNSRYLDLVQAYPYQLGIDRDELIFYYSGYFDEIAGLYKRMLANTINDQYKYRYLGCWNVIEDDTVEKKGTIYSKDIVLLFPLQVNIEWTTEQKKAYVSEMFDIVNKTFIDTLNAYSFIAPAVNGIDFKDSRFWSTNNDMLYDIGDYVAAMQLEFTLSIAYERCMSRISEVLQKVQKYNSLILNS